MPEYFRIGCGLGVGLFLALIGLRYMAVIKPDPNTFLTLNDLGWQELVGK